jgi:hypothetical protein
MELFGTPQAVSCREICIKGERVKKGFSRFAAVSTMLTAFLLVATPAWAQSVDGGNWLDGNLNWRYQF